MAMPPDGKIVLAGRLRDADWQTDLALARFAAAGQPDRSFGNAGVVVEAVLGWGKAADLAVGPDGSIIVAGRSIQGGSRLIVRRYQADGQPDAHFADNGRFQGDGTSHWARSIEPLNRDRLAVLDRARPDPHLSRSPAAGYSTRWRPT